MSNVVIVPNQTEHRDRDYSVEAIYEIDNTGLARRQQPRPSLFELKSLAGENKFLALPAAMQERTVHPRSSI
jgi:hypothetical protein